jgi:hypothetical protein
MFTMFLDPAINPRITRPEFSRRRPLELRGQNHHRITRTEYIPLFTLKGQNM